jgi:hypothetical protein
MADTLKARLLDLAGAFENCSCSVEYKDRGLLDPACDAHDDVGALLRAAASALPDEPSTDVWSEWEGLRDAYAKAYRWQALPVGPHGEAPHTTATRTALDTFFRRCIGVRREPDAYTLTFDSKFSASKRCRALFMDGNGLKTSFGTLGQVQERAGNFFDRNPRIEGVYIDRAPVITPDEDGRAS